MLKHFKELDGLRGLAALMIIFFHFFKEETVINSKFYLMVLNLSRFGQTGVPLFFVLSGFLISRILLSTKNSKNYLKTFYIRRSLRLFPLYYFFLIIYYFLVPFITKSSIVPFKQQWTFWLYLQNFALTFNWNFVGLNHLWSLAVEEHFYLFWPFLIYFLNPKQLKNTVYGIFIGAFFLRLILTYYGYDVFYFTFTNIDSLAIGSLLAIYELEGKTQKKFGLLFVMLAIPVIALWPFLGGTGNVFVQLIKSPLIAITYYAFIGYLIFSKPFRVIRQALKSKFLTYTGKISYGLYVYHPLFFLLYLKSSLSLGFFPDVVICLVLPYIIASLSYYLFEVQFLRFKKYFRYQDRLVAIDKAPVIEILPGIDAVN